MYRHLVNEIYHTVVYTLLPIDYVHDSQISDHIWLRVHRKSADAVHDVVYIATALNKKHVTVVKLLIAW